MKKLICLCAILAAGCQSISIPINASSSCPPPAGEQTLSCHGVEIKVEVRDSNNKNVEVPTALKGNVPLQGGSVTDNGANVAE